jgi:hypothetical protein
MPATPALRLGELVATFALAQDNAFGQPLESQLRSCLLATWMAGAAGSHSSAPHVADQLARDCGQSPRPRVLDRVAHRSQHCRRGIDRVIRSTWRSRGAVSRPSS